MGLKQEFCQIFKDVFNFSEENFLYGAKFQYGGYANSSLLCNGINKGHNDMAHEYDGQQDRFRVISCSKLF